MAQTLRISRPGYNALTDTDIDHYSLYADSDNVLIKEKTRGSTSVSASSTNSVAHGLSYVPLFMAYFNDGTRENWVFGTGIYGLWEVYADTTNIHFKNKDSSSRTFKYYIFYDQQV